ncbi:aminotransferase class V-fold PLP-dependent enzyme [Prevotella sp. E13-17]|uniref:pyridoxal-phosphate-dependent aminotransferase family protein n=1 Tax=Prevotella sp. E13-17 TaxID=2913616 RepID=UPI001EDB3A11|nr:aminotransferase class V-fold PLP-dependent enzyme [Prevotella sp. E13-17]UKK50725.1 aminotransferase class V-fold PLP-dependent enzyme [Prevotella sp. E13-17]
MLNFTVGPVMSSDSVRAIGSEQVPYFRTPEFSEIMFENERLVSEFAHAPQGSRVCFMTGSGTASMEATVMNVLSPKDKAIVVNGGSFGHRFVELLQLHQIPHHEISLEYGQPLTEAHLAPLANQGYTAFLVNMGETSTGVLYDMPMIGRFCRENGLLLIVDAISTFLADPFDMDSLGADVMITGSQKALACPPGISLIVLSPRALERVNQNHSVSMYLDLKSALKNGERGQTPFTPAVGTLLQINQRLRDIKAAGGVESELSRMKMLSQDFRQKVAPLPFKMFTTSPQNGVTALSPQGMSAYDIFTTLKDEYQIWICPNGGDLRDRVFRVGHLGALTTDDNTTLINAMLDMQKRGLIK